jgi:hypothetical protein
MGRIQKVSNLLRAIMLVLLIVEGACVLAEVFMLPVAILHPSALKSQISYTQYGGLTISWGSNATGASNFQLISIDFGSFILLLVAFMVTLNFFRLFTRLKDGHLFEGQTIDNLEHAGKWWIVLGIVEMIYQFFENYVSSPHHINISLGAGIFGGLIVFFIAWVLREGQKLKEEQELTV